MKLNRIIYMATGVIAGLLFHTSLAAEPVLESKSLLFDETAVSETELASQRGSEGLHTLAIANSLNDLDATLNNNVADSTISGNNYINGGAFSRASGHATVIQNSGANTIILDSTIYNFTIFP